MSKFILASQSPRRKSLLEWAEIPFEVIVSNSDESFPEHLSISEVPAYIAKQKALEVANKLLETHGDIQDYCFIAADTIVVLNNEIMGKPLDRAHAIQSLTKLSGKTHDVITGVCVLHNHKEVIFAETTKVTFHALSNGQIEYYVDQYKPYDKAGGYAIQEWIGVVGIKSIEGDFYNVMGLPVSKVVHEIKQLGLLQG
jgi:septum formation protein